MSEIAPIEYFAEVDFDPFEMDDAVFGDIEDPYSLIAEARSRNPVLEGSMIELLGSPVDNVLPVPKFMVLGYKEVDEVMRNPHLFSNESVKAYLGPTFGDTIPGMDPPRHQPIRRQFQKFFLPAQIKKWSDTLVDPVVTELIGQIEAKGYGELVEEFAKRYPFEIIYRQLGLPERDTLIFHKLAVTQTFIGEFHRYGIEAGGKLGTYLYALLEERRKNPGSDLVSMLCHTGLADEVIVSFFRNLINAAGDTTYRATGCMMIGLLSNQDQLDAVRNDRSLIPQVLEETLRWNPPILFTQRTVTQNTELGGVALPEGAVLHVSIAAANNDPEIYENPRKFDLFRGTRNHFGFGIGSHMCLGQHLARLEMTRALTAILDRLPNLRLDPDKPAPTITGGMMRTPRDVHVLFG